MENMEVDKCNSEMEAILQLQKLMCEKLKKMDERLNTLYKLVFKLNEIDIINIISHDLKEINIKNNSDNIIE